MADASTRGWGTGWPHCDSSQIRTLTRGDGLRLPVRAGILELVAWLLDETERRGYDVKPGQTWGYACRAIRGYNVASNHSWGLAVDVNAPANPMLHGQPGWKALHDSHRTDMPDWMPTLWGAHMFRWGGDYATRQDAMHYEFMGTPSDAARITSQLHGHGTDVGTLAWVQVMPGMKDGVGPLLVNGQILHEVAEIQLRLASLSKRWNAPDLDPGKLDGAYGFTDSKGKAQPGKTGAAVVAFKKRVQGLQALAHQPVWPHADSSFGLLAIGALRFWSK